MKRFAASLGVVLAMLTISALAFAVEGKTEPLTGAWDGMAHAPEGDEQFTMTLEQTGDDVKGSFALEHGQLDITSGSFKNNVLEVRCETPDATYVVTGKLENGRLSGEWSKKGSQGGTDENNDSKGTWEAKRSEAKAPAK